MFYLRNRKHVPCFFRDIETQVEVWANEKCHGKTLFETHFGVYH